VIDFGRIRTRRSHPQRSAVIQGRRERVGGELRGRREIGGAGHAGVCHQAVHIRVCNVFRNVVVVAAGRDDSVGPPRRRWAGEYLVAEANSAA